MPTESAEPPPSSSSFPSSQTGIKCSLCGAGASSAPSHRSNDGVVILSDPIERICGGCVRAQEAQRRSADLPSIEDRLDSYGLGISGMGLDDEPRSERNMSVEREDERDGLAPLDILPTSLAPLSIHQAQSSSPLHTHSRSLPSQYARPWTTANQIGVSPVPEGRVLSPSPSLQESAPESDLPANPLLDVAKSRVSSQGRGALYPGSIFKGTQTSGRSAYEVEVTFLDVNFPESTLSGYLSISHLTDAHPHLTTFFTGEIIGPKHGFITGPRLGATEHDDMRHWGRFEQFRRPSTRADMVRPELFFRDPLPDRTRGETKGKERDFVFLRIKERFLVPDHTVRDISGASFAGFYFAMVDLNPVMNNTSQCPTTPTSPTVTKTPLSPISPTVPRRMSSSGEARSPSRPEGGRRRQSSSRILETSPVRGEATIRGYYFHSLNQEPFQELFLTHVPSRSSSTMELR